MNTMLAYYISTALYLSCDSEDRPLDARFTQADIHPDTLTKMEADCTKFQNENADSIGSEDQRAGVDFWLTRNGHGAGFWDGGWSEEDGERLTKSCESFGEFDLYVGDDGKVHGSPL